MMGPGQSVCWVKAANTPQSLSNRGRPGQQRPSPHEDGGASFVGIRLAASLGSVDDVLVPAVPPQPRLELHVGLVGHVAWLHGGPYTRQHVLNLAGDTHHTLTHVINS